MRVHTQKSYTGYNNGDPCPICSTPLVRRVGGLYCPKCKNMNRLPLKELPPLNEGDVIRREAQKQQNEKDAFGMIVMHRIIHAKD